MSEINDFIGGIKHLIKEDINKAPFDRTYIGRVVDADGDTYTVLINGKEYPKTPTLTDERIDIGDFVKVSFSQNNPNNRFILNGGGGGGASYDDTELRQRIKAIEDQEDKWDAKQDAITDLTTIRSDVSANTTARHTHNNKSVLDGISAQKVQNWDNAPYIIESSTVNGWYYEKWSNGRLICSRILSTSSIQTSTTWGSVFTATWMDTAINKSGRRYPIPFIEEPIVEATPMTTSGNFWLATNQENDSGTDGDGYTMSRLTHAPAYQCVRGTSTTITNPKIAIRAEGKWQ